jgi:prepilin-type processing-associated H-X9-DG protein
MPSPVGFQNAECNRQTTGMFHQVSGVRIPEVTDGLSNTVMIAEAWGYEPHHDRTNPGLPGGCEPALPGRINLNRICDARGMRISALTKFDVSNPNGKRGRVYAGRVDRWFTVGSFHPGGIHVAMGDGSVRFVEDTLHSDVFNALATKDGNEPLGLP